MTPRYLFADEAVAARWRREMDSWIGTPWKRRQSAREAPVKGVGGDCANIIMQGYLDSGVLPPASRAACFLSEAHEHEILTNLREANRLLFAPLLEAQARGLLVQIPVVREAHKAIVNETLMAGDILLFGDWGRTMHLGAYRGDENGNVYHAMYMAGFAATPLASPRLAASLQTILRPVVNPAIEEARPA